MAESPFAIAEQPVPFGPLRRPLQPEDTGQARGADGGERGTIA